MKHLFDGAAHSAESTDQDYCSLMLEFKFSTMFSTVQCNRMLDWWCIYRYWTALTIPIRVMFLAQTASVIAQGGATESAQNGNNRSLAFQSLVSTTPLDL